MGIQDYIAFYDNRADAWPTVQAPLFDDPRRIRAIGKKPAQGADSDSLQLVLDRKRRQLPASPRAPVTRDEPSWQSISGDSTAGSGSDCGIAKCGSHVTVNSSARLTSDVWLHDPSYGEFVHDNPYSESADIIGEYRMLIRSCSFFFFLFFSTGGSTPRKKKS